MKNLAIREFSKLVGLTTRRLYQLRDEGIITPAGRGEFPPEAITAIVTHYRQSAVSDETKAQRLRLLTAEADHAEIDVAERRGELTTKQEFHSRCDELY